MDINEKLDLLKKIQRVDAPPFLFTRILSRIGANATVKVSASWKISFVAAGIVLLGLNLAIILRSSEPQTNPGLEAVVSTMELSTSNQLYHE
ncbi:MAG: hypothetical protein SH819_03105 [Cytophagales bacterium]|nr:hypothetical protein [Cytophagales bacterium]